MEVWSGGWCRGPTLIPEIRGGIEALLFMYGEECGSG